MARKQVEKPFNGGRWSRARFFGFIRSQLRLASRKWPPRIAAKNAARRPYVGENVRQKWEYKCAYCGRWFKGDDVEVDHIEPAGSLKCYDDLPGFVSRLFCEAELLQLLCKDCHGVRTKDMEVAA